MFYKGILYRIDFPFCLSFIHTHLNYGTFKVQYSSKFNARFILLPKLILSMNSSPLFFLAVEYLVATQ